MPDAPETFQFTADRGDARLRLDQALVRRLSDVTRLSRTLAQQWIAAGLVQVDGQTARRSAATLAEGAAVAVALPESAVRRTGPEAQEGRLDVLYEDDALIALDKPPGVVVHPTYKQTGGTLLNAVLWRMRDRADVRPGILTRLDKDTSGLVLIALTAGVHATMQRDAGAGLVKKEYVALVQGTPRPREGRIVLPLGRDPADRRRVIATADGAPSETRYTADEPKDGRTRVVCELVTGRTHQIRVHLATQGWPVVGDRTYGDESPDIARQALHAWRVSLPHPVTREPLTITAPIPADIAALL
jgi:23S rRNA pseudouridine1911/1915/1917 synthase